LLSARSKVAGGRQQSTNYYKAMTAMDLPDVKFDELTRMYSSLLSWSSMPPSSAADTAGRVSIAPLGGGLFGA
jgi:hypothetical protein